MYWAFLDSLCRRTAIGLQDYVEFSVNDNLLVEIWWIGKGNDQFILQALVRSVLVIVLQEVFCRVIECTLSKENHPVDQLAFECPHD
jgi:hypothetical protein